ncbi:hypothetical protein HDU93_010005 [Gonapodya sp. JEL0774]|nr:hypothetical protein HDU93_010005 [Gonapodya sp. JEL0774]
MPESKRVRTRAVCAGGIGIGDKGPLGRLLVRGEPGWEIIPELAPLKGEIVIDKPGKNSFYATDLDMTLQLRGIKNLILTGVTTDVCVHSTMRAANDRGYECIMVTDCTAAAYPDHWAGAISQTKMQGGVFGTTGESGSLREVLNRLEVTDSSVQRGLGVGAKMEVLV